VYELLTRTTPFFAADDMTVYENILGGIEGVKFSRRVGRNAEVKTKFSFMADFLQRRLTVLLCFNELQDLRVGWVSETTSLCIYSKPRLIRFFAKTG